MVKNTKGGKGAKSIARKSSSGGGSAAGSFPLSTCELEKFGFVSKIFGNCMCQILFHDGSHLIGHIRGKFRGRNKRNNILKVNDIVLVGLRDLENPPKNCDILFIYDDNDVRSLLDIPSLNIHKLLDFHPNSLSNPSHDVLFSHDSDSSLLDSNLSITNLPNHSFSLDSTTSATATIDLDDI
jgi:initiation factor 1A